MLARWAAVAASAPPTGAEAAPPTLASSIGAERGRLGAATDEGLLNGLSTRITARDDGTLAPDGRAPAGALLRRFEQFFCESEQLVPGVAAAMGRADGDALAPLVDRSQALTESHLRNTLEETEWLPAAARRLGALAASAFGAGFGGSVWAVVHAEQAETLLANWEQEYAQRYPQRVAQARFFAMRTPAPGARSVG